MQQIKKTYIWERNGIWQFEYHMFLDNKTVKKVASTGVKTSEKDHTYMVTKYSPAKALELMSADFSKPQKEKPKEQDYSLGFWTSKFIRLQSVLDTADRTETRAKAAVEYFGKNADIREIAKSNVKEYLLHIAQKDGKNGNKLNRETVKSYLNQLSGILQTAIDDGVLIASNPAKSIDKVPGHKSNSEDAIRPFSVSEVKTILEAASGDLKNYLGIAFHTGMSPEEIIALMPQDLNFEKKTIKIQRVITHKELKQGTKTIYRTRTIRMFESAVPYLQAQMSIAKSRRSMFLFCKEDGARLDDISDLRGQKKNNTKWYGLLRKCEIEHRDLKNTRHTFAVESLKSGKFTPQQLAKILGHADLRMIINHYAKYIEQNAGIDVDAGIDVYENKKEGFSNTLSNISKKVGVL